MSPFRPVIALCALSLLASTAMAQGTTPAVSTVVAFSISNPIGNIVKGDDGALYGIVVPVTNVTTGLIYRAAADGTSITTLYQLSNTNDAVSPQSGLFLSPTDNMLYGTTRFGRGNEVGSTGTIFKVSQAGTGFSVLRRFDANEETDGSKPVKNDDGAFVEAELIEGAGPSNSLYLYGVASAGGANRTGTIFRVSRLDGNDFATLHAFDEDEDTTTSGLVVNDDGAAPVGPLVQVGDFLYGTTSVGGDFGRGVIFRIGIDGTGFKSLKHFSATTNDTTTGLPENADGAIPLAGLTHGGVGDNALYGVTSVGGTNGQGVIFRLNLDLADTDPAAAYDVIHTFSGNNGTRPTAELLLGSDGKLYGTTSVGGETTGGQASTLGTFFSIDRNGDNFKRLQSFAGDVGAQPGSRPLQLDAEAKVFAGTLTVGGKCGYGAIWRYSATGDTVTGNTRCGRGGNNSNSGGGFAGFGVLALLGVLGLYRRRYA